MKKGLVIAFALLLSTGMTMAEKKPAKVLEQHNGHEYVDMGLTTEDGKTIYWATCNVGAKSPEECGTYFAWGDINGFGQKTATEINFRHINSDGGYYYGALNELWGKYRWVEEGYVSWQGLNKYTFPDGRSSSDPEQSGLWYKDNIFVGDNKRVLDLEDDAVNFKWGGEWRMPTENEFEQLLTECKWVWKHKHGVPGYMVKSKKTKGEIFLPVTFITKSSDYRNVVPMPGIPQSEEEPYERSYYWTSTLSWEENSKAVTVFFDFYSRKIMIDYRFVLMPVRGVYVK